MLLDSVFFSGVFCCYYFMGFILFTLVPMVLHGGFAEQLLLDEAVIKKMSKTESAMMMGALDESNSCLLVRLEVRFP